MTERETQPGPEQPTPEQLTEMVNGIRGQYLLSQALHYGIEALESADEEFRELSNIEDMKYLYRYAFPLFKVARDMEERVGSFPDFIVNPDDGGDATTQFSKGE